MPVSIEARVKIYEKRINYEKKGIEYKIVKERSSKLEIEDWIIK